MIRYAALHFAAGKFEHRCRVGCQSPTGVVSGALLVEGTIHCDVSFDFSELEARVLELPDLLPEGLALLNVLHCNIQRTL